MLVARSVGVRAAPVDLIMQMGRGWREVVPRRAVLGHRLVVGSLAWGEGTVEGVVRHREEIDNQEVAWLPIPPLCVVLEGIRGPTTRAPLELNPITKVTEIHFCLSLICIDICE